jgi:thioredoxin 2
MTHLGVPPTVSCPRCGASNRVVAERARGGLQPVCGRCRAALPTSSDVVEVTDSRFEEQVLASPLPVLLDVWAPWCVPCRGMEPVIEELASSLSGRVRVVKLNVDRSPEAVARLRIQGVPTVIVFKDGHEVTRMVGARGKSELMRALAGVA